MSSPAAAALDRQQQVALAVRRRGLLGSELREPETVQTLRNETQRTSGVINARPVEAPDYTVFTSYDY